MDRDFKGVWIPKEIYLNHDLSWSEKILLIEIDSLDNENGCFASNAYFAEFLQVSETRISRMISKLKSLSLIQQESFNGRDRVLHATLKLTRQPLTKVQGRHEQKCKHNNTRNNIAYFKDKKEKEKIEATYALVNAERMNKMEVD